jgi:hypothetical protein
MPHSYFATSPAVKCIMNRRDPNTAAASTRNDSRYGEGGIHLPVDCSEFVFLFLFSILLMS